MSNNTIMPSEYKLCSPVLVYVVISIVVSLCSFMLVVYYNSFESGAGQLVCNLIWTFCCSLLLLLICNVPNVGNSIAWFIVLLCILSMVCNSGIIGSMATGHTSIEKVN